MNKECYDKFYGYLCEVVEHYQKNGTLRNFSQIAKKWGVKAITTEFFFIYNLHRLQQGCLPTRELSDNIRKQMSAIDCEAKARSKYKFSAGEVVAWERNGYRSVAVMRKDGLFSICLNYRGREDEQDRLWEVDNLPADVKIEKANISDMKRLVNFLVDDCYRENLK